MYVGGVGTVYSQIQKLVPARNICVGNGVNWLRKKINLKPLSPKEIKIPKISGNLINFPIKARTIYLVTQIGCPNTCDFCITHNFLKYSSFSKSKKIIEFIEDFSTQISRDGFIFLCEPNSLFPELTWKKVFEYFIENRKNFDNNLFLFFSSSLNHINKFDLEVIQHKSPLKFFMINYGIESTIKGYPKNQGDSKKVIERLNKLGVFTNHNYIIGLPFHTKEIINLEIRNNLGFNSDLFAVHSFKPIPSTLLYKQLELENSLYSNNVPHEFLYASGFLPFNHKYIGGGFEILKYFFKAIYEGEKKTIDVFDCFANKLLDLFAITNSRKIKKAVKVFMGMSKINLNSFQARMPNKFTRIFKKRIEITSQRYKKYVLGL